MLYMAVATPLFYSWEVVIMVITISDVIQLGIFVVALIGVILANRK